MKMIEHSTASIYRRYAIVHEAMLKQGATKLQTRHDASPCRRTGFRRGRA